MRKSSAANRYIVQERYAHWGGREGQNRLAASTAVIVGVGALGGTAATLLARAGVGRLRLIDPDSPSLENLHRQILYTEADIKPGVTKAKAAADYLKTVNSEVLIEPLVARLDVKNAESLLLGADVVLDGLDNMESRYVLNEACHRLRIPWVHAGVVGPRGQLMVIRAGKKPCLRCWSSPESASKQAAQVPSRALSARHRLAWRVCRSMRRLRFSLAPRMPCWAAFSKSSFGRPASRFSKPAGWQTRSAPYVTEDTNTFR